MYSLKVDINCVKNEKLTWKFKIAFKIKMFDSQEKISNLSKNLRKRKSDLNGQVCETIRRIIS